MTRHRTIPSSAILCWLVLWNMNAFAQSSTSAIPPSRIWVDAGFGSMSRHTGYSQGTSNTWIKQKIRGITVSWAKYGLVVSGRLMHVENSQQYYGTEPFFTGEDASLQAGWVYSTGRSLFRLVGGIGISNRKVTQSVFDPVSMTFSQHITDEQGAIFPFDADACWTPEPHVGVGIGVSVTLGKAGLQLGSQIFVRLGFLE